LVALERIEAHDAAAASYISRLEADLTKRRTGASKRTGPESSATSGPR